MSQVKDFEQSESFAHLRTYLAEPSSENWRKLLDLLDNWPEDNNELAITYARSHLQSWPDALKECPSLPLEALLEKPSDWPAFQLSSSMVFCSELWFHGVEDLIYSLEHMTSLTLEENEIYADIVKDIVCSPKMASLTSLSFIQNSVGDLGLIAIADSPHMANLTHLKLWSCGLEDVDAIIDFANSPHMGKLTHLNLGHNVLSTEAIEALVESPYLTKLTHLDLTSCELDDEAAITIANAPTLSQLTHLNMRGCYLTRVGAEAIATSPHISALAYFGAGTLAYNEELTKIFASARAFAPELRAHYLDCLTVKELRELAAKKSLSGRSKMSKKKLVKALSV